METKLLEAIMKANDLAFAEQLDDWVESPYMKTWMRITEEEKAGIINPTQSVLELGSGNGIVCMMFASRGYDITGIERSKKLTEISKRVIVQNRMLFKGEIKILNGSYYPEGFTEVRNANPQITEIETRYSQSYEKSTVVDVSPNKILHLEESRIQQYVDFKSFDIFFAYLWPFQMPSTIELFKHYSKSDAKLFLTGPHSDDIAKEMGLKQIPESQLYRK